MGNNSFKFIVLVSLVSILFLSPTALASTSLNVSVVPVVQSNNSINLANTNVTIFGSIVNTTTSDTISPINITAAIGSNSNSQVTGANGLFNFNVTAPSTVGEYNLSITNNGSLPAKSFTIYVSNATAPTAPGSKAATISYIGKFPPFTNGTTFTVNITLFNGSSVLVSYSKPLVQIYETNGQNVSWTVTNLSATTNASGSIAYNMSVPSTATTGEYAIVVDRGIAFTVFRVGSGFQIAVTTRTAAEEVTSSFSPGSTVDILVKLRTSSGDPVTGATATATVTYPNGTTTKNVTLSAHPSSDGFYNSTFTDTNVRGQYKIKVIAVASGNQITGSAVFNTKTFEGRFEPLKTFFFEWGGQSAFKPSQTVGFDIVTTNLTDGGVINWASCPHGNLTLLGITFVNGTNTTLGNASVTYSTDTYLPGTNVCKVQFTGPSTAGSYNIRVNVTVVSGAGNETQTIDGFFSVQTHFLKVTPVLDVGGFEGFHQVFAPGTNVSLQLKAINVSGNTAVSAQNITSHRISKIVPLEFSLGTSEVTNINQTSFNGINSFAEPNITFTLPESLQGPLLIEVTANVIYNTSAANTTESVTGTTFLISNYLNGFIGPQATGGAPTHEGMGAGGFSADARCSSTQTFSGSVTDSNTSTAAQGAIITSIIQAREENTGKDVSGFLSIAGTSASDSNGALSVNITFSPTGGYSFSGNYFMVFNATYKGKATGIPAFFMCRNLNMGFALIKVLGSDQQFSWQVAPSSALNVTLTNVANMTGTLVNNSSVFVVSQIFNFNPSTGSMQALKNNTPLQVTFGITGNPLNPTANKASLSIYPQNYSIGGVALAKWPNGFFDLRPSVTSNLGADTGFGGFMIVAFDAFPEFQFGQQYPAGSNQSIIVRAATNVSNFTITMGRPWEGALETATVVNASLLSNGWNSSADTGNFSLYGIGNLGGPYERWNVTFTVPSTLRKGGTMLTVKVTSNATGVDGESVEVPLFVTVSKYNVITPNEEMVGDSISTMDAYFIIADGMYNASTFNTQEAASGRNASAYGWNLTWINQAYSINSTTGRVCVKNTFNSTRLVSGQQQSISINGTANSSIGDTSKGTRILVVDRSPSSGYNTIILNRSNETVILNSTSRSIGGQLYLWNIKDCSFFTMVNVSNAAIQTQSGSYVSNSWGGSQQANTNFTLPYVIISGNARQNGATVAIKSVAKQDNRGFGFEGKLASSQFVSNSSATNSDGLAFVTLNLSSSGRFMAFWRTTIGTDADTADMSSATFFEVKGFSTSAQSFTPLRLGAVVLTNDTNNRTGLLVGGGNDKIFNGTITETADGDFVANGVADNWNIIYNASDNKTRIVNTTSSTANLATAQQSFYNGSISLSIYTGEGVVSLSSPSLKLGEWSNSSNTLTAVFFTSASGSPSQYFATTATQNISAVICAEGFQKPTPLPVENATINVSVTDWSSFPPSVKYLDMYKLSDGSKASASNPILTSPSGCVAVLIGPGQLSSWPSASGGKPPVFIEGTVTKGSSSEFVYVGDVFRP